MGTLKLGCAVAVLLLQVATARAVEPMAPVQQQLLTCSLGSPTLSRVSTAAVPGGCCAPQGHCVEALSTTILDHAYKGNRT